MGEELCQDVEKTINTLPLERRKAHSSYRVTGNAAYMGQAAGRVAALTAKRMYCRRM